jgi:ribosomal protein S20
MEKELRTAREENGVLTAKNQQLESQMKDFEKKVSAAVLAAVSEALATLLTE